MAPLLFKYTFTARMHDIDAAGIMFFARTFYHAHDAYEAFLYENDLGIIKIIKSGILLPISHSEADYKVPVLLNESINIEIYTEDIGENEFSLRYLLKAEEGTVKSSVLTRHVCVDSKTHRRTVLPDFIKSAIFV